MTALALPLLFSLVTGAWFQKGWWRHFFRLRVGSGRRLSWSSTHRFVGLWPWVFGALIGVTGAWYFVEQAFVPLEIAYPDNASVPEEKLATHDPTPSMLRLDSYVAAATRSFPELQATTIEIAFVIVWWFRALMSVRIQINAGGNTVTAE